MPLFKIDDLQVWTAGKWFNLPRQYPEIRGFSTDSRNVPENFAFIALIGERDGHDFIEDAVKNGAVAVIASKEVETSVPVLVVENTLKAFQTIAKFHRLRFEFPVVAITGSCGKTSTKEFLANLISWKKPLYTEANFNNEIGVPLTLTKIDMRENASAIVEAGVGAVGQMKELAEMIEPDLAIITCVAPAHMEKFGEIGAIAREKAILASHVAEGGWALFHNNLLSWKAFEELECKKAILAPSSAPEIRADIVFRYSLSEENGFTKVDMNVEGGNEYYFEMPIFSAGMTENALLAIAAALMLGTNEEQLVAHLETLAPVAMRGSITETQNAKYYVDCYNASPASMKDALRRFLTLSENSPRMFVVGTMAELGLATIRYHREIGELLPYSEQNKAILVGSSAQIYKDVMLANGWTEDAISIVEDASAAKDAVSNFEGWVFIKGSRVCGLEKSLPDEVLEKLSISNSKICVKEDEQTESIDSENSQANSSAEPNKDADENDEIEDGDENISNEEFDDFEESENFEDDEDGDNSDSDENRPRDFEDDERF